MRRSGKPDKRRVEGSPRSGATGSLPARAAASETARRSSQPARGPRKRSTCSSFEPSTETSGLKTRIRKIIRRLEKAHGPRPWTKEDDPVEQLVGTILSQNTNDVNSAAAYEELTRRFRTWQDVLAAPLDKVADAIRTGGLASQKARTIQRSLARIRQDFGRISLDDLATWDPLRSMDYLTSIPGIGPKTAACVLMFAFSLPVFPVDTHIHRLALRLGLVSSRSTAVQTQQTLQAACPVDLVYPFHVLLITHGRRVCHAQRPDCAACVLNDLCPSASCVEHDRRPRRRP